MKQEILKETEETTLRIFKGKAPKPIFVLDVGSPLYAVIKDNIPAQEQLTSGVQQALDKQKNELKKMVEEIGYSLNSIDVREFREDLLERLKDL